MGTSKAKKSRRNGSGKAAGAKRQRRADRKAKSSQGLSLGEVALPIPVWQYPDLADETVEQGPTLLTYEEALVVLLAHPVHVSKDGAEPVVIGAIEEIMEKGGTMEGFIGGFKDMHRLGVLEWDPVTRVHHMNSELAALEPH